jgi:hypothetical protein
MNLWYVILHMTGYKPRVCTAVFFLLSLTSLLSAPEREVTSPSDFKVVGALSSYFFCSTYYITGSYFTAVHTLGLYPVTYNITYQNMNLWYVILHMTGYKPRVCTAVKYEPVICDIICDWV